MHSYCCDALVVISIDTALMDKHAPQDWYYCSHCHRPCDRMKEPKPRKAESE